MTTEDQTPEDWYKIKPGGSIDQFHKSNARYRFLIGGRGSGKTTAIAVETIKHAWEIAGARIYILRLTESSNQLSTVETFGNVFSLSGTAFVDTGISLFKKIDGGRTYRLPSRKAVEKYNQFMETKPRQAAVIRWLETEGEKWCSFVHFSGVPTSSHRASRFRGFECSLLILVEGDQFKLEDLTLASPCLRWKSPDPAVNGEKGYIRNMGIVVDTNPPGTTHWIAELEADMTAKGNSDYRFWHIPTEENRQNLPENYIEDMLVAYRKKPAMLQRMVYGQYADAFEGTPVWPEFGQEHVFEDLPFPRGAILVRGWDFGTTQANVWSAYWMKDGVEYWWVLHELVAEQSDAEKQCHAVLTTTQDIFPFWNDRSICAGVLDYCDPAGNQQKDTGRSTAVLQSFGIYPGYCRAPLQESIAVVARLLSATDKERRPVFRIDKVSCPRLYAALSGGYRYPSVGEPGYGSDGPGKGPAFGNYDHVCFVSGTLVTTRRGEVPIELVSREDEVLTRSGWCPVKDVWISSEQADVIEARFSDGRSLMGTPEHPVWVVGSGWRRLDCLRYGDKVSICNESLKSSFSEGAITVDTQTLAGPTCGTTTPTESLGSGFIELSGNGQTGRYLPVTSSTTKTGTASITTSLTLSACPPTSTSDATQNRSAQPPLPIKKSSHQTQNIGRSVETSSIGCGGQRPSGIGLTRAESGTEVTLMSCGILENPNSGSASSAERITPRSASMAGSGSAATSVSPLSGEPLGSTTKTENAPSAEKSTEPTNTLGGDADVHFVAARCMAVKQKVYALQVRGVHEFFANRILVKNCDAARYSIINCIKLLPSGFEKANPLTGPLAKTTTSNRKRRWY